MSPRLTQNLDMLAAVAKGLRGLKEKVVFVGGATIDLYLDDPAVAGARPTDDVDCVVELTTRSQYYDLEERLRKLDFKHPMTQRGPVCRRATRGLVNQDAIALPKLCPCVLASVWHPNPARNRGIVILLRGPMGRDPAPHSLGVLVLYRPGLQIGHHGLASDIEPLQEHRHGSLFGPVGPID